MTPWDIPNLTERALALYKDGKSATEIASAVSREFGVRMTRSAVIGKCHRKGWIRPRDAATVMTTRQLGQTKQDRIPDHLKVLRKDAAKAKPTPFTYRPVILAPQETPAPVPLNPKAWEPLEGMTAVREVPGFGFCRWPIGDLEDGSFGYCGAPACNGKKGKVSSYCSSHYVRAYRATPPKSMRLPVERSVGVWI